MSNELNAHARSATRIRQTQVIQIQSPKKLHLYLHKRKIQNSLHHRIPETINPQMSQPSPTLNQTNCSTQLQRIIERIEEYTCIIWPY